MDIDIKGHPYRIKKLDVFAQLHLTRRLLPFLSNVIGEIKGSDGVNIDTFLPVMATELSKLTDDECNAIIYPCLGVVSRQHGKSWTPVFSQNTMMFDDIELIELLTLTARVIQDSLGNFLLELPANETTIQRQD